MARATDDPPTTRLQVAVRVRPTQAGEERGLFYVDSKTSTVTVRDANGKNGPEEFTFDMAFDSNASQGVIFEGVCHDVVKAFLAGQDAGVLTYGQTGAGKTYTMEGAEGEERGIVPRAIEAVMKGVAVLKEAGAKVTVRASHLEFGRTGLRDLLLKGATKELKSCLDKAGSRHVPNLTSKKAGNAGKLEQIYNEGNGKRRSAATKSNPRSSRSHSIFTISLTVEYTEGAKSEKLFRASTLTLVDLAGTERTGADGATGELMDEGCFINKSLSALRNVIDALISGKRGALVPFRNSLLTLLLQDLLSGSSKVVLLANASPAEEDRQMTLNTLRYACKARKIIIQPKKNVRSKAEVALGLSAEVERFQAEYQAVSERARVAEQQVAAMKVKDAEIKAKDAEIKAKDQELAEARIAVEELKDKSRRLHQKLVHIVDMRPRPQVLKGAGLRGMASQVGFMRASIADWARNKPSGCEELRASGASAASVEAPDVPCSSAHSDAAQASVEATVCRPLQDPTLSSSPCFLLSSSRPSSPLPSSRASSSLSTAHPDCPLPAVLLLPVLTRSSGRYGDSRSPQAAVAFGTESLHDTAWKSAAGSSTVSSCAPASAPVSCESEAEVPAVASQGSADLHLEDLRRTTLETWHAGCYSLEQRSSFVLGHFHNANAIKDKLDELGFDTPKLNLPVARQKLQKERDELRKNLKAMEKENPAALMAIYRQMRIETENARKDKVKERLWKPEEVETLSAETHADMYFAIVRRR